MNRIELKDKILELKKRCNAVIIAHNYQRDEVQEIADITGDSLALSQAVVSTRSEVIVFCGVHFMAESAAILNPTKTVLLPVEKAGCPMADMIDAESLRQEKLRHPDAAVVCYVNSSAEVKAESDICCTSSNAIEIVRSLTYKKIIFVPDKNLGRYVQRYVKDKQIILWQGFCPTHVRLTDSEVLQAKEAHPAAEFIAHPECQPSVLDLADHVCSTGGMFKYVRQSACKEFIIGTECGMLYRLRNENPDKQFFIPSERLVCPNMKLTTLGWVLHSLQNLEPKVSVSKDIRLRAKDALERMLEVSGEKQWQALAGY